MALNFPTNPGLNDTYSYQGTTYVWDGEKWDGSQPFIMNTANIVDGAVTTAKIADGAVTISKIDDATVKSVKAMVNFAGSSQLIRKQFNVSSITRLSAGSYRVNFTTPLPDADYIPVAMSTNFMTAIDGQTTTSFEVSTFNNSATREDSSIISVVIY